MKDSQVCRQKCCSSSPSPVWTEAHAFNMPVAHRRCLSAKAGGGGTLYCPVDNLAGYLDRQVLVDSQDRGTSPLVFEDSRRRGHAGHLASSNDCQSHDATKWQHYSMPSKTYRRTATHSSDVQLKVRQCEELLRMRAHSLQVCFLLLNPVMHQRMLTQLLEPIMTSADAHETQATISFRCKLQLAPAGVEVGQLWNELLRSKCRILWRHWNLNAHGCRAAATPRLATNAEKQMLCFLTTSAPS